MILLLEIYICLGILIGVSVVVMAIVGVISEL